MAFGFIFLVISTSAPNYSPANHLRLCLGATANLARNLPIKPKAPASKVQKIAHGLPAMGFHLYANAIDFDEVSRTGHLKKIELISRLQRIMIRLQKRFGNRNQKSALPELVLYDALTKAVNTFGDRDLTPEIIDLLPPEMSRSISPGMMPLSEFRSLILKAILIRIGQSELDPTKDSLFSLAYLTEAPEGDPLQDPVEPRGKSELHLVGDALSDARANFDAMSLLMKDIGPFAKPDAQQDTSGPATIKGNGP